MENNNFKLEEKLLEKDKQLLKQEEKMKEILNEHQ
jgi:hypothetical protein